MASEVKDRERASSIDVHDIHLFGQRLAAFMSSRAPDCQSKEGKAFIENVLANLTEIAATCEEYKG